MDIGHLIINVIYIVWGFCNIIFNNGLPNDSKDIVIKYVSKTFYVDYILKYPSKIVFPLIFFTFTFLYVNNSMFFEKYKGFQIASYTSGYILLINIRLFWKFFLEIFQNGGHIWENIYVVNLRIFGSVCLFKYYTSIYFLNINIRFFLLKKFLKIY